MGDKTAIEWTDATWTPIRARRFAIQNDGAGKERIGWHCEHASEACRNCYAEKLNLRLGTGLPFKPGHLYRPERAGYHNGEARLFLDDGLLIKPLQWRRPRHIFVCSMTDLFGAFVPDELIDTMLAVMGLAWWHKFQVLTKRSGRMRLYLDNPETPNRVGDQVERLRREHTKLIPMSDRAVGPLPHLVGGTRWWPLANLWAGVSAEDQPRADERVLDLVRTRAARRFVSYEPALGPIDFTMICAGHFFIDALRGRRWHDGPERTPAEPCGKLDQIIAGGESGPRARPSHPDWFRSTRDQCAAAGTAFFFKQWGDWRHDYATVKAIIPPGVDRYIEFDGAYMERVGKKRAGALLDGREHREMPR